MRRGIFLAALVMALSSCGESSETRDGTAAGANAMPEAKLTEAGDPCTLLADPVAIFGEPMTANIVTMPNKTKTCEWRSADGRSCGSVVVFGPGWNDVPDVPSNYAAMVTSLGAFGQVQEIVGLGEEARAVDGGMLGAQVAFRTSEVAVLAGSACSNASLTKAALAERVARAVAEQL